MFNHLSGGNGKEEKEGSSEGVLSHTDAFEVKQPQASLVWAFICLGERHVCVCRGTIVQ